MKLQSALRLLWLASLAGCAVLPVDDQQPPPGTAIPTAPKVQTQPASDFPIEPQLRLNPEDHFAAIRRTDVDAQGRWLVSGARDKTVKVWRLADGTLERTLRPPQGAGHLGSVFAVAIAPDGAQVAVGGWMGTAYENIYIFDRATGALTQRIEGLPNVIFYLAFSPDGQRLVAMLGGAKGMRLYRTIDYEEIARDPAYGRNSVRAGFAADGRLVTSSLDGKLRLYGPDGELKNTAEAPGGQHPIGVAFAPNGRRIAVGYADSTRVDVLDAGTLAPLYTADTAGIDNGSLGSVAWSADGRTLLAGGTYPDDIWSPIRRWSRGGRGPYEDLRVAKNTVMTLHPLPDGRLALGATDTIALLDTTDQPVWDRPNATADFRGQSHDRGLRLSPAGDIVAFGYEYGGRRPARFSLGDLTLTLDPKDTTGLALPDEEPRDGLEVSDWVHSNTPQLNGRPLALDEFEMAHALALAPDGAHFVLGTDWSLYAFDRSGTQLWRQAVPSVWAVNISGDGRYAVAGYGDGTLRWHHMADGAEVLALYPHPDGTRWVLWTPEGFFDASPGGAALFGYHLNRGANETPEFVAAEQLYDLFYRPDLVQARFLGDEDRVRSELARLGDVRTVLERGLPPKLVLVGDDEVRVRDREFTLTFKLAAQSGGLGTIIYRVNGVVVEPPAGRLPPRKGPADWDTYQQPVVLVPGKKNVIEVSATTRNGEIESTVIRQVVDVTEPELAAPALYGIIVGINDYYDGALTLKYAAPDAQAVAETVRARGQRLFRRVDLELLVDAQATLDSIETAFARLAPRVEAGDVFMLYLAGHGLTLDGRYHFFPYEFVYGDNETVRNNSLSQARLAKLLNNIQAQKSLVVLDTCQAGSALPLGSGGAIRLVSRGLEDKAAIARLMHATGRDVLAASTSSDQAFEGYQGHGVFTYAMLEGLKGRAERNADRYVDVDELGDYVIEQVPELTLKLWKVRQVPQRSTERGAPYPIATVE